MKLKVIAAMLLSVVLAGCANKEAVKSVEAQNYEVIKAHTQRMQKDDIQLTCPETGCVIQGITVNISGKTSNLPLQAQPKSTGEKILDSAIRLAPVIGNVWLQDRNGQRSIEASRISSETTLGILKNSMDGAGNLVEQSLGSIPEPVVVNPEVIKVPTQVIEQPTIQDPVIVEPTVIQVPQTNIQP